MAKLSDSQRLTLQQLRLLAWAEGRGGEGEAEPSRKREGPRTAVPSTWVLTEGFSLRPWQEAASQAWFSTGRHGTIKVVTGAGKTMVALAIAEQLQREDAELRVAIVVPTIVLMGQWYASFADHSNLDPSS